MRFLSAVLFTLLALSVTTKAMDKIPYTNGAFGSITYTQFGGDNITWKKSVGYGLGFARYYQMEKYLVRTGIGLVTKSSANDLNNAQVDVQYIEVPVSALYKFTPVWGAFAGIIGNFKAISSTAADYQTLMFSLNLGLHFVINGKNVFEPYFERGLTKMGEFGQTNNTPGESIRLDQSWGLRYVYLFL